MNERLDMLCIGDTVIDNFIRLKDAAVHCDINNEHCTISMRWGDKIPFEFNVEVPAVGNSANAAVSASRLGLSSALRAFVGNDEYAEKCLAALTADNVNISYIEKQNGKHTNYHFVLWYESERTILIKHEQFDYQVPTLSEPPAWVYLSSLGENSLDYHHQITQMLSQWPQTKLAFQPGTFQMKFGTEALKDIYARAEITFCNKEESQRITGSTSEDPKELLQAMKALGPKTVAITDGEKGAYALDKEGTAWFVPIFPDGQKPYEITGAGDAFASSVACALALGKPLSEALLWGPINARAVTMEVGAQKGLLTKSQLEERLSHAPTEYKLKQL